MAFRQAAEQADRAQGEPGATTRPAALRVAPPPVGTSRWYLPALVVLVLVGGAGGTFWWFTSGSRKTHAAEHSPADRARNGAEPASDGQPTRVDAVHPHQGGLRRNSTQPGSVHSFEYADLEAKVSGYLVEQNVDIGDHVQKDQVLAKLFDPEVVQEARRAAAELDLAKSQADQAEARIKVAVAARASAAAMVTKSQAELEHYKAELTLSGKQYKRISELFRQKAIDEQLVDEKLDALESAQAALHSGDAAVLTAKAQLDEADAKIDQTRADLLAAKAHVQVDEANLAKAKAMVDYTTIKAPYAGVITKRNFHVGEFIRSAIDGGTQPLLTVARTDKMRVVLQLPDSYVPYCNPGDPARVTISTLNDEAFPAKVSRIAYSENPETRTMRTEVDLPNPDERLREGMYGNVTIELEPPTKNLTIPSACLVGKSSASDASVYVVQNGRAHMRQVRKGTDNGVEVEILSGLTPDDLVIMPTNSVVAENQPVAIELLGEKKAED